MQRTIPMTVWKAISPVSPNDRMKVKDTPEIVVPDQVGDAPQECGSAATRNERTRCPKRGHQGHNENAGNELLDPLPLKGLYHNHIWHPISVDR